MEKRKLQFTKAIDKAIDIVEEAIIEVNDAPFLIEFIAEQERALQKLERAWTELRSLYKKLNPPF